MQRLYKTIWEIPQKQLINLAIGRGPYICQSQSLNLYMAQPVHSKMSSMHFYSWSQGLKTGQYYFRSRPARDAIKFTVNVESLLKAADKGQAGDIMEVLNTNNADANHAVPKDLPHKAHFGEEAEAESPSAAVDSSPNGQHCEVQR